ncbi:hypothetical protein FIBSPDRAFT_937910 [Athelia psychrophila]|uniref:Uncharacterized protein n=1 Tax=Athelia psychrophila TaxID=1759441 RepID=A0A165ZKS4_9AGAM|nr:hypothetical protein FIBSPDRAFT_937910 [Fibularhizoctonia sp. CBS 109695]
MLETRECPEERGTGEAEDAGGPVEGTGIEEIWVHGIVEGTIVGACPREHAHQSPGSLDVICELETRRSAAQGVDEFKFSIRRASHWLRAAACIGRLVRLKLESESESDTRTEQSPGLAEPPTLCAALVLPTFLARSSNASSGRAPGMRFEFCADSEPRNQESSIQYPVSSIQTVDDAVTLWKEGKETKGRRKRRKRRQNGIIRITQVPGAVGTRKKEGLKFKVAWKKPEL